MKTITGRLENWTKGNSTTDGTFLIWGDLYDDVNERWASGSRIHTSNIKEREVKEGDIVETLNSAYLLGKPREVVPSKGVL